MQKSHKDFLAKGATANPLQNKNEERRSIGYSVCQYSSYAFIRRSLNKDGFMLKQAFVISLAEKSSIKMVIDAAAGKSHADLLKQYILNPLELQHTYYQPYDELP